MLLRFGDEVSYYLSYYAFQQSMELHGFAFVTPTVDDNKEMSAQGLYDLALACASLKTNKEVVSNDMNYCEGERFFVLTGPNQGGKTTFARSLGQLIYFSKMGLDVPATAANYDACIMGKKVLEHFIRQECRGIYVTHLKELTKAHESVVSMRAMLDEQKVQSFKICRQEADDSACALNQVNKYRLTYEQLKERLN